MPFDIHQRMTDPTTGRIDREAASAYNSELLRQFRASPEWQARLPEARDDQWLDFFLDAAVDVTGLTAAQLAPTDLRELLDEIFPVELYYEDGDPAQIVADLRTLYAFVDREYALPNAAACLAALDDAAVARLRSRTDEVAADIEEEAESLPDEVVEALDGGSLEAAEAALDRVNEAGITDDEFSELAFAVADRPPTPSHEKPPRGRESKQAHAKAKRKMAKDSRKKNRKK